jgi:hypothetical protein
MAKNYTSGPNIVLGQSSYYDLNTRCGLGFSVILNVYSIWLELGPSHNSFFFLVFYLFILIYLWLVFGKVENHILFFIGVSIQDA